MIKNIFCAILAIATMGCAAATVQTDALLSQTRPVPNSAMIADIPFYSQTKYFCGPATLAMALDWAGKKITIDEIAPQVYTPGMKGSLQQDMITAAQRQGLLALPISGLESLLKEISAGHPVIVFENLGLSWLPQYHYAIVFGYDLNSEEVIMHSGPDAFKHWDLRKFERSWMLGDYWGMVVLPPEELSAVAGEVAHLKAASAIEVYGKIPEAGMAYQQILKKWPASVGAEIGLANTSFAEKNYPEAIRYLQNATEKNPDLAIAWYNLAVAQAAIGATSDSQKNFALANKLATPEQKKIFARNLN